MKAKNAFFLCILAGVSSGAAMAAPGYDMTVLTEPSPIADHYFGGQDGRGISLSADGRTLMVSASTGTGGDFGKVYVFQRRPHGWSAIQELDGVEGVDLSFGSQVQVSRNGKAMLIASTKAYPASGPTQFYYNDVYHYSLVSGVWKMDHIFNDPDLVYPGDGFGTGISMSADGGMVLISAPAANRAYVYSLVKGSWARAVIKDPTGSDPSYYGFGEAVALSADGTRALISNDPYVSDLVGTAGEVYLYALSDGNWRRTYRFKDPAPQGYADEFGQSGVGFLANGSIYIADAQRNDGSQGTVFVYRQDSPSTWGSVASMNSPSAVPFPGTFGWPVAAGGQTLLIGGSVECIHAHYPMSAYVFKRRWSDWSQPSTFTDPLGCTADTDFDSFVAGGMALSDDLSVIVIASGGAPVGALQHAGSIYIYQVQTTRARPIPVWPR